jgi:chaperonin GroEL
MDRISAMPHRLPFFWAVVVEKVMLNDNQDYGFNAETESFGNLVAEGVIDPAKVTRAALQNAASIASLLLTSEASVSEYPEQEEKTAAGSPGGMGRGMY